MISRFSLYLCQTASVAIYKFFKPTFLYIRIILIKSILDPLSQKAFVDFHFQKSFDQPIFEKFLVKLSNGKYKYYTL